MDNDDLLLLAKEGCEYKDARIVGTEKIIGYEFTDAVDSLPMRFFDIDCAKTQRDLYFNLKISIRYVEGKAWTVGADTFWVDAIKCTTQEEISDAINTVALEILRGEK